MRIEGSERGEREGSEKYRKRGLMEGARDSKKHQRTQRKPREKINAVHQSQKENRERGKEELERRSSRTSFSQASSSLDSVMLFFAEEVREER